MDLAAGARRVVVLQSHVSKDGQPKPVAQLTLPPTARGCANRITELVMFDTAGDCFVCVLKVPGVSREMILGATGAPVLFTTVTAGV